MTAPRPGARMTAPRPGARTTGLRGARAVALGGGHGLHATLSALRLLTDRVTAVVTVADDGGSSGRLRRELGLLPPGDLRMALAALAADDVQGRKWATLVQHRFGGSGALAGHAVGNLLLAGLMDTLGDPVAALDEVGALLGVKGRVLPMCSTPLDIEAEVSGLGGDPTACTASVARSPSPPPRAGCSGCGCARSGHGRAPRRWRRCWTPTCCCSDRVRGSPACCRTCSCRSCATP